MSTHLLCGPPIKEIGSWRIIKWLGVADFRFRRRDGVGGFVDVITERNATVVVVKAKSCFRVKYDIERVYGVGS